MYKLRENKVKPLTLTYRNYRDDWITPVIAPVIAAVNC